MAFPSNPNVGDTYGAYTWNGTAWVCTPSGSVSMDPTPPTSPNLGDLWWDPVGGQLYIFDAANQWTIVVNQAFAGPAGPPGPSAVSANAGNTAVLGTDHLIFVPASGGGGPPFNGVTDGSDAAAGQIGENLYWPVGTSQTANVSQLIIQTETIPPGDWDVTACVSCSANNATFTGSFYATATGNTDMAPAPMTATAVSAPPSGTAAGAWWGPCRVSGSAASTFYITVSTNITPIPSPFFVLASRIRARRMR